ncbi:MAG: hypothetical protein RR957_08590, partial [Oscillospiraceae bacterium]
MKKQVVSIILACGVFMGCLSGCGGKTSGNTGGGVANDGKVSDKPIELTIFQYEKKPFDNDFPVFKKAAEMTNVSLKSVLSKSTSDKAQAFNLMM